MVNVKMGTALLTGSSLLKQKERADELFVEEVRFLRSCFLESPEKAKQLTQLRQAREALHPRELRDDSRCGAGYSLSIRSFPLHFFTVAKPQRVRSALPQSRSRPLRLLGSFIRPRYLRSRVEAVFSAGRRARLAGAASPDRRKALAGAVE